MSPEQFKSQYDRVAIKNILDEDFYWRMGQDPSGNPIEFKLGAGEEIELERFVANHAIKKMIQKAIDKFETHEVNRGGKMVKMHGGIQQLDPSLQKKYREMIVQGEKTITVSRQPTFTDRVRAMAQETFGRSSSDEGFASLNTEDGAEDEVSKMSFPKLKKVGEALGIKTNTKGMTQDKLREEVRKAMTSEE